MVIKIDGARVFTHDQETFAYEGVVQILEKYVHVVNQDEEYQVFLPHSEVKLIETLGKKEEEE